MEARASGADRVQVDGGMSVPPLTLNF
jgi:hypothetical protein